MPSEELEAMWLSFTTNLSNEVRGYAKKMKFMASG
jgi:hypothetical protein